MINFAFILAGVTAVFFIVLSGIKYLLSGGDIVKVESAKKSLTFSVLGLFIILLSFLIIKVVSSVVGVDCIKSVGFNNC